MVGHGELGDLLTLMYPWRIVLAESFRRGELPFWDPHSFVGSPFLANPISAVFYPPHWLYAVLPVWLAWSVQFPLRLMLATFFAAVLARRLGASRSGSLVAGWIFGLSGFQTGWQGWPQADVVVWTPLCLLGVLELRRSPGPRAAALLALALALSILAGHPGGLALLPVRGRGLRSLEPPSAAWRRRRRLPWAARYVACLILAGILAAGICAVQLVPTAEWLPRITRSLDRLWGPRASRDWLAIVSRDTQTSSSAEGLLFPEEGAYAGVATLLLSPLAFFLRRKQASAFFGLLGFAALSVTFGWFPFSPLFRAIPVFRAMPGNRILGILDLSLATLAGLGWTALGRLRRRTGRGEGGHGVSLRRRDRHGRSGLGPPRSDAGAPDHRPAAAAGRRPRPGCRVVGPDHGSLDVAPRTLGVAGSRRNGAFPGSRFVCVASRAVRSSRDGVPARARHGLPEIAHEARRPDRVPGRNGISQLEIAIGEETIDGDLQALLQTRAGGAAQRRDEPGRGPSADSWRDATAAAGPGILLDLLAFGSSSRARTGGGGPARASGRALPAAVLRGKRPNLRKPHRPRARVSPDVRCRVGDLVLRAASVSGIVSCETPGCLVSAQTFYPGWRARLAGRPVDVRPTAEGLCSIDVPAGQNRFRFEFRP